ncbi:homoserine dehydrogenase family protein [Flavobacterium undicola]|uniref:aspartate kinase n=1 Tax=Flavobacterium undicola TaxID=1932779 RepID=UPI00293C0E63|nr:aspartate kinase [Flavobacterium undicola]
MKYTTALYQNDIIIINGIISNREIMSAIRINVVLFGIGNIGSELLSQVIESQRFFLEKRNIDLRFPIITNSTLAFFEEEGVKNKWEADFTKLAFPYKFQDILDYVQEKKLENLIAVDATASSEIIKNYIPLIQNGFNIVAANKKANTLHIEFYKELRRILKKHDKLFLYEATVGAGLPVIKTIRDLHFSGEKITKIRGVFSGSLSYIFNRFSNEEEYFSAILKDAEKLGLTEPDSREDLAGNDVARKLLILAREIENEFDFSDVKIVSLLLPNLNENNSKADYTRNKSLLDKPFRLAKLAQAENNVLRYIGELDIAKKTLQVKPVSVSRDSVIGQLKGADNLVEIYTKNNAEPIVIQGAGAGRQVTARSVLTDILEVAEKIKLKESVLELI